MSEKAKMCEPIVKNFTIKLLSWLHIGWGDWGLKIGWIDSSVVKNPLTGEPYIPWSSIKWKMRASLEMINWDYYQKNNWDFWPSEENEHKSNIAKSFWMAWKEIKIASRLIFSDFEMIEKYKKLFDEKWSVDFMEDKSENSVPRFLQWNANPRHIERVPASAEFEWTITLIPVEWIYPISQEELEKVLEEWLKYLNMFWLGWWVSRWNGRIEIKENI